MHMNWSMRRDQMVSGNEVKLKILTKDKSEATGSVDIGDQHKNWLYSKSLFIDRDISSEIENIITNKMIDI